MQIKKALFHPLRRRIKKKKKKKKKKKYSNTKKEIVRIIIIKKKKTTKKDGQTDETDSIQLVLSSSLLRCRCRNRPSRPLRWGGGEADHSQVGTCESLGIHQAVLVYCTAIFFLLYGSVGGNVFEQLSWSGLLLLHRARDGCPGGWCLQFLQFTGDRRNRSDGLPDAGDSSSSVNFVLTVLRGWHRKGAGGQRRHRHRCSARWKSEAEAHSASSRRC